jgi:predicted AlkP superfamily phosphohydrolase/phosphomutase
LTFLSELIGKGSGFVNRSMFPSLSIPAIPAFFTGKNPGKLGFFCFEKPDGSIVSSNDIKEKRIWDYLGERDLTSATFNLIGTYPASKIKGIMVSHHAPSKIDEYGIYPKQIKAELGDFPIGSTWYLDVDWSNAEETLKKQIEITRRRSEIAKKIVKERKIDFAIFWITGTDVLHHYYRHKNDILLRYYQFLESLLREWIGEFGDRNFIIMSDHGGEDSETRFFYANSWLEQERYLKMSGKGLPRKIISDLIYTGIRIIPRSIKEWGVKSVFRSKEEKKKYVDNMLRTDWKRTHAYLDGIGIRISKSMSSKKYEKMREEIIQKLLKLRDNGKRVVREAWKREGLYNGPYVKDLPDIIVIPHGDYFITSLPSRSIFGKKDVFVKNKVKRTGGHNSALDGIFITFGPDIKRNPERGRMSILDIAPTILHMYGLPVPEDMDGRVLKEIFRPGSEPARREEKKQKPSNLRSTEKKINKKDEERIKESLRALGYIE